MKKEIVKKNKILSNLPNFLTISRIILTFVIVYLILIDAKISTIIIVFVIGALTDFFDGLLARKYGWTSEFGRKADMIADRILWIGTALTFFIVYSTKGRLDWSHYIQLMFIMTREIIAAPFTIAFFFTENPIPKARFIAKTTTFLQGFALPLLILSTNHSILLYFSWPLSIIILIVGFKSAMCYIKDNEVLKK